MCLVVVVIESGASLCNALIVTSRTNPDGVVGCF